MVVAGDIEAPLQQQPSWRDYVVSLLSPGTTNASNHHHDDTASLLQATSEHSATSYHSILSNPIVQETSPHETVDAARDMALVDSMQSALGAYQLKQAFTSIGASPFEQEQNNQGTPAATTAGSVAVKGGETDGAVTAVAVSLCLAVAATGVIAGGMSYWLVASQWVDAASISLMVIAPMVAVQKIKLQALGDLRGQLNILRASVNAIHEENKKLTSNVDELQTNVESLQSVQADLQDIAKKSGATVDKLVSIVHENGEVQAKIKSSLEAQVMQQIMTACLQSDRDQDFTVSKTEVETLILRLKNMPGVQFQEQKFRQLLKSDKGELTMADLCRIARNMKGKSRGGKKLQPPPEDAAFVFKPRQLILS